MEYIGSILLGLSTFGRSIDLAWANRDSLAETPAASLLDTARNEQRIVMIDICHDNQKSACILQCATSQVINKECSLVHNLKVRWAISFHDEFDTELDSPSEAVQDEMLAHARLLEQFGPQLGRPRVDTLKGSTHAKMRN